MFKLLKLAKLIKKHQKIYETRKLLELPERATEVKNYLSDEEWWFERFGEDPLWRKGK